MKPIDRPLTQAAQRAASDYWKEIIDMLTRDDYRAALLRAYKYYRRSQRYSQSGAYQMARRMTALPPSGPLSAILRDSKAYYDQDRRCFPTAYSAQRAWQLSYSFVRSREDR